MTKSHKVTPKPNQPVIPMIINRSSSYLAADLSVCYRSSDPASIRGNTTGFRTFLPARNPR
jgi:hypothetical protein